jgi:hypothetical protein
VPETTTIQINVGVWQRLNSRKQPGDSFNDVLIRLLDDSSHSDDSGHSEDSNHADHDTIAPTVSIPDSKPNRIPEKNARDAITAAVEFIQANDGASMREIVVEVMPEHPLDYDVPELEQGERYRGSWYRKVVKPGLEEHPEIRAPKQHESLWRTNV